MKPGKKPSEAWIYDQVFGAILEQRLRPETKLTENELCDVFGVSRTIIRKVLLRLSLDRVVELRPNRARLSRPPNREKSARYSMPEDCSKTALSPRRQKNAAGSMQNP